MEKIYVEVSDIMNNLVEWINSGEYKKVVESIQGETKDEIFKSTILVIPSVILAKCNKFYR